MLSDPCIRPNFKCIPQTHLKWPTVAGCLTFIGTTEAFPNYIPVITRCISGISGKNYFNRRHFPIATGFSALPHSSNDPSYSLVS